MVRITTRKIISCFSGTGPITLIATEDWPNRKEVPQMFTWIHDGFAVAESARHPSFPERICVSVKPERHPFGFWLMEAKFVVERYRWNNLYNQAELIMDAWDGPTVKGTGCI